MIEFDNVALQEQESPVKIKVIGIGGAGGNTVNSMIESDLSGIEFIVANTDAQALKHAKSSHKVHLGAKSTKGLGAGANPDLGRRATEEDLDKIMALVGDADIVFIAAGMGGGTGSGGAPIVAKALKERGILSIAVVTKPFLFEGKRRMVVAQESLDLLKKEVDTLLVIPNQKLLDVVDRSVSMIDSFAMVNDLLIHCVKSIADIIVRPGHINVDFADLRATMKGMGLAMMGTGKASGKDRALEASMQAISSNLIENMDIRQAKGILLNITGGPSLTLHEINDAASVIYDQSCQDAHIIIGSVIDQSMGDEVVVSIIATGFEDVAVMHEQPKTVVAAKKEVIVEKIVEPVVSVQEVVYVAVPQAAKIVQPQQVAQASEQKIVAPVVMQEVQPIEQKYVASVAHVEPAVVHVAAPVVAPVVEVMHQVAPAVEQVAVAVQPAPIVEVAAPLVEVMTHTPKQVVHVQPAVHDVVEPVIEVMQPVQAAPAPEQTVVMHAEKAAEPMVEKVVQAMHEQQENSFTMAQPQAPEKLVIDKQPTHEMAKNDGAQASQDLDIPAFMRKDLIAKYSHKKG